MRQYQVPERSGVEAVGAQRVAALQPHGPRFVATPSVARTVPCEGCSCQKLEPGISHRLASAAETLTPACSCTPRLACSASLVTLSTCRGPACRAAAPSATAPQASAPTTAGM